MEKAAAPIYIFGLGLEHEDAAMPRLLAHPMLESARVLVGGKRQLAFFGEHPAEKLQVGKDIPALLERIKANSDAGLIQAVLCSGDPLYFSLGGHIAAYMREQGMEAEDPGVRIVPGTGTLQAAAALLGFAWEHVRSVSLHGRDNWLPLAHALASGEHIFLLTDAASSPEAVAAFLWERGCEEYAFHILDRLYINAASGTVHAEARQYATVAGLLQGTGQEGAVIADNTEPVHGSGAAPVPALRVIFLERKDGPELPVFPVVGPSRQFSSAQTPTEPCGASGIFATQANVFSGEITAAATASEACTPRDIFGLTDELVRRDRDVLTKLPVRTAGLGILGIAPDHVVWDLGAGSGAVSIEAGRLAWRGKVLAVEKNVERVEYIRENRRMFRAVNLEIVHGAIQDVLVAAHGRGGAELEGRLGQEHFFGGLAPRPHRIFVGGGLSGSNAGEAAHLLRQAWELLLPGGALLAHCVLLGSLERARHILEELGGRLRIYSLNAGESRPLAGDVHFAAMNPVFLVYAGKSE